MKTHQLLQI